VRIVASIRLAVCSMMLACTGMLSVPLAAHAEGDAAAGEKLFAHCAPFHSTKPDENKVGPSLAGVFGRKSGTEPQQPRQMFPIARSSAASSGVGLIMASEFEGTSADVG
jgi:cytochrome c2